MHAFYNVHTEYGVLRTYILHAVCIDKGKFERIELSLPPPAPLFLFNYPWAKKKRKSIDQECTCFWTFNVCVEGFREEKKQRGFSAPPHSLLSGFFILTLYYVYITFINSVNYEPVDSKFGFPGVVPVHWYCKTSPLAQFRTHLWREDRRI